MIGKIARKLFIAATVALFGFSLLSHPGGKWLQAMAAAAQPQEEEEATEIQVPEGDEDGPEEQPSAPPAPSPRQPPRQPRRQPAAPERRGGPAAPLKGDLVSLNFNRADLIEVVHVLAQHLKLTYTIDPEVKGTVTINSAEPLKKEDLLPIFHQILRMNDAVAVKNGDLYRIAPIEKGKGLARPLGRDSIDSYAIQVVPVRFFSVVEMKKLLTPFITPKGEIIDYPRGNFLMVMDIPANIQRLMEIRDLIDVQTFAGTRTEIYEPKVASAEELATEMTKVMQAYAASSSQAENFAAQFLPIPRINQLLVVAHSEAAWTYTKRWLERIDVIAGGPGRRIFVYPVENSKAADLADILTQAMGLTAGARPQAARSLQDLHRGTTSQPSTPGGQRGQGQGGLQSGSGQSGGGMYNLAEGMLAAAPAQQQQQRPQAAPLPTPGAAPRAPAPGAKPDAKPEEQLRIIADPTTNILIIYGTLQEFQNIKNILKELDIMPRQVLMDVLVAAVDLSDTNSFGVEWAALRNSKTDQFPAGKDGGPGLFAAIPTRGGAAGLTALIGLGGNVRTLITALASDGRAKLLAAPSILATDNKPARIQVGSEEPVPTGNVTAADGAGTSTSTTIQYRNTGKIVTIIPQVNSKGLVNLQIKAEVSKRGANVPIGTQASSSTVEVSSSSSANTFPAFDTTDVETTAVVQDGETLVIAGLIDESKHWGRSGVPFFKDLPVIGRFFGLTTEDSKRTELVLLITPHVIRNVQESKDVTEEFKEKVGGVTREIERTRGEESKAQPFIQRPRATEDQSRLSPGSSENARGSVSKAPALAERQSEPVERESQSAPDKPQPSGSIWSTILNILTLGSRNRGEEDKAQPLLQSPPADQSKLSPGGSEKAPGSVAKAPEPAEKQSEPAETANQSDPNEPQPSESVWTTIFKVLTLGLL